MTMRRVWCLAVAALAWVPAARADVQLRHVFSDNMVLQRGAVVPVFGTADEGEQVTVKFRGQEVKTTAKDGRWRVDLANMEVGGPFEMTVSGKNTLTLKNILVGEVWIGSGQSNMQMNVARTVGGQEAIAASANPKVRLLTVPRVASPEPQSDFKGSWVEAGPTTTPDFSAVLYYFGRDLQRALGVPVGLIHTSWGGTPAEAWTPVSALQADPELKTILDEWDKRLADYPKAKERWEKQMADWREKVKAAKAENKPAPPAPRPPGGPDSQGRPGNLYNAMILPLAPFAFTGAVWYQGEANSGRADQYAKLLPAMIRSWRKLWGGPDFPFYIVALAPFHKISAEPVESNWARLREAQYLTTKAVPNAGLAVINDSGDENDIHPQRKQPVGERLALLARAKVYGQKVVCAGPTYRALKVEGASVRLSFDHLDGGLVCKGDKLTGFTLAGADRTWYNADARIDGDTIVVTSAQVPQPVALRYGWADYPVVNLWNGAGLMAVPFRTDDWPAVR
jgi:sialate O-acetylesterase